jgi:transcriptional regulator with XRE-family HTH domain
MRPAHKMMLLLILRMTNCRQSATINLVNKGTHLDSSELPERPSADAVALGKCLRQRREELGLSLRQLALKVGTHASYLGRLETGAYRRPPFEYLPRIAEALKISYADLFTVSGYGVPEELPSLVPYLRVRYNMSEDSIREANRYFEQLQHQDGININQGSGPRSDAA